MNGDGLADIIVGTGPGGGPRVRVFNGHADGGLLHELDAYPATFSGGVYVAAGDLNGDGRAEIITGPGAGGDPIVRVFDSRDPSSPVSRRVGSPERTEGVRVATVFEPDGPNGPQNQLVVAVNVVLIGLLLPAVQKAPIDGPPTTLWIGDESTAGEHAYVAGAPEPARPGCRADFNRDGLRNPDDLSDFIACYFSRPPCPRADFDGNGETNPDDLSDFIGAYFGSACE